MQMSRSVMAGEPKCYVDELKRDVDVRNPTYTRMCAYTRDETPGVLTMFVDFVENNRKSCFPKSPEIVQKSSPTTLD